MTALTAELTRLMNNVRLHAPGALDDTFKLELFNALNDFCTDSKIWQEDIDFETVADQREYTIVENEAATMITLMSVVNSDDIPVAATMKTPAVISLQTLPSEAHTLTARVALTVVDPVDTNDYPYMPEWLLKKYYATILEGVVGLMMAQPAKPYTNERMAIYHTRKFRSGIAVARAEVRHQNLYGGQTWRFPSFAKGSQK